MHPLEWLRFNPACLDCGARYICVLRRWTSWSQKQRGESMTRVVEDWVAWGHDEAKLRAAAARDGKEWQEWARELHRH